jgi:hypothetical protein
MTDPSTPYFFDEAERASNLRQPGVREKALSFTLADLKWLKNVYLATEVARTAQKEPMYVYLLLLNSPGTPDIPLAGAFAMSRPDDGEVTLYTPWKGLIKFADMDDLKSKLKEWLASDTGKQELLRFLSIEQRNALSATATPDLSTTEIAGAVFQDQQTRLEHNQALNISTMMGELLKMPTLQSMLDDSLKNALHKPFPGLDQRLTRLKSFVRTASPFNEGEYHHTIAERSLSDALLHFYLANEWPAGDSRVFAHPGHGVSSDADNLAWESAVKEIAQSFTPHLHSQLDVFWNTDMSIGRSRRAFFSEGLRDTFHLKLLLQRQDGTLTTQEYLQLNKVSSASTDASLRVEKVRVTAPFKHYAELASALIIGAADTLGFLYTPSRGIEATDTLSAVKTIVLQMLKSEGHEDTLLNFMSLEERSTFLALAPDECLIEGRSVTGPVFEEVIASILGKQRDNLSHALTRYRESEGTLSPHALIDNALDVRGLLDDRLLACDAAGRWSTRVDLRWSAQPVTVRADSAKEGLLRLDSVKQALDQLLDTHPAIPPGLRTLAQAQSLVSSSVANLQSSFTHTLSTALRTELKLRTVTRTLGATEQAIIKTVLDSPIHLQRAALNGFLPGVFSLALQPSGLTNPLQLASCFVVTERGGLDPKHSGKTILWTPALGFEAFESLSRLRAALDHRLKDHTLRLTLLENLGRSERLPDRSYTMAALQQIHGHFLDHLQKPYVQLDQTCITRALATPLPTAPLADLLNLVALRQPLTGLRRATDIALSLTTQQKLPTWLANASIKDLVLHGELLQQYLDNVKDDEDYLTGLRSLHRTAHVELGKQLKADTFDIDPDKVLIQLSARPTAPPSVQTLTDFALTPFKALDQARFTLESLDSTVIPDEMDERYIKDLIRKLKTGEQQQKILSEALADTPANTARRKRFYRQLPWQLMHYAHTEKLQERLSETGFDLVRQIMDMPDAIARAAVDGAHALIRPLEFLGIKPAQAIKVAGVYLIGSATDSTAPQVLVAPHSPRHGIKEYESEVQLLAELKTRGPLLDWILTHLPQPDRTLLEQRMAIPLNRGTRATSASSGNHASEVTLASNPIRGHLFSQLFNDNAALLGRLLGCQSDDKRHTEWATIKHVLGEDLHQALSFFMGKLTYPITVWRSYRDIKQSAEDLQTHKWGAAIGAFISGIAQLATLRQSLGNQTPVPSTPLAPVPAAPARRFNWHDVDITAPERTQASRHEGVDVDLGSLTLNSSLGLYTHPTTRKQFAAVEGKVYPVARHGTRWRIAGHQIRGPVLRQNEARQWILDRESSLPHFSLLDRLDTAMAVWGGMNVDARGMAQIRRLFPFRARQIDEALDQATSYAWNCFRNVQLLKSTDDTETPVHQLVADFIGVPHVLPAHVEQLEKTILEVFSALLDPTLRKPDSTRFVVGRLIDGAEQTFAFIAPKDAKRKIHLADKFFSPGFDHYRQHLRDAQFPINAHSRAMTIIHELAHLACKAEDISYLDVSRPFADLIETSNPIGNMLKTELSELQSTALSVKSPYTQLFMIQAPDTGEWEELGSTSLEDTSRLKDFVLTMTGAENLSGARQTFKKDPLIRLKVQLSNADSIAWLIGHLGRQLHVSTP